MHANFPEQINSSKFHVFSKTNNRFETTPAKRANALGEPTANYYTDVLKSS